MKRLCWKTTEKYLQSPRRKYINLEFSTLVIFFKNKSEVKTFQGEKRLSLPFTSARRKLHPAGTTGMKEANGSQESGIYMEPLKQALIAVKSTGGVLVLC